MGARLGATCGRCLRGLVCSIDGPPASGVCLRMGDVGETCDPSFEGRDCIPGATCLGGLCVKQNDEGGACPCARGISCIGGRCVRERLPEGAACDMFAEGQCDTGLACRPVGDAGMGACAPFTETPQPQPGTCP
ncbi:MAG: hypothetical protein JNM69_29585 [Archangium sp.]|nr:hypothetical protein [Archangium sp.]